ncbi:hypothetical protein [Micromonospora sp. NPDC050276]|uniref:hypothetical protein n=1 Tax=Micromonospora sp. NPDC050276 TaxID=3364278 RepID=UPI0037B870D1
MNSSASHSRPALHCGGAASGSVSKMRKSSANRSPAGPHCGNGTGRPKPVLTDTQRQLIAAGLHYDMSCYAEEQHPTGAGQLLRYRNGQPITYRRYDHPRECARPVESGPPALRPEPMGQMPDYEWSAEPVMFLENSTQ